MSTYDPHRAAIAAAASRLTVDQRIESYYYPGRDPDQPIPAEGCRHTVCISDGEHGWCMWCATPVPPPTPSRRP